MSAQVVRQRAEVIEGKDRIEAIFRANRHALILVEDATGKVVLCNPGAEQLLGYLKGEIVGRPVDQIIFRESDQDYEPELKAACSSG